jgi:hypothetical protein
VVPGAQDPLNLNRYAYSYNNPLRYTDPSGHSPQCAVLAGGGPLGAIASVVCEIGSATASYWPQIQVLAVDAAQFMASRQGQVAFQLAQEADAAANQVARGNSDVSGEPGNPQGRDPRSTERAFRNAAEQYQHQTSGTRFGSEVRLNVNLNGPRTIDVDGIVDGFLHESKYINSSSTFYGTKIGQFGTGLRVHVMGWKDELQRLSLAAQQNGYEGAKVFVNNEEAIKLAQELYGKEGWFKGIEFILKGLN